MNDKIEPLIDQARAPPPQKKHFYSPNMSKTSVHTFSPTYMLF